MNDLIEATETRIRQLGIKKSHVASRIDCTPAEFSHFLKGRRVLSLEKTKKLRDYLNLG
jgi:antitoxin component HigA of HigAB toxin-antitoxin module